MILATSAGILICTFSDCCCPSVTLSSLDRVAKTHQLLCCCKSLTVLTYISTPHCLTFARLAGGVFCFSHPSRYIWHKHLIGLRLHARSAPAVPDAQPIVR